MSFCDGRRIEMFFKDEKTIKLAIETARLKEGNAVILRDADHRHASNNLFSSCFSGTRHEFVEVWDAEFDVRVYLVRFRDQFISAKIGDVHTNTMTNFDEVCQFINSSAIALLRIHHARMGHGVVE